MSLNLTDDEIQGLIHYARGKFADEQYPFARALRAIWEVRSRAKQEANDAPRQRA